MHDALKCVKTTQKEKSFIKKNLKSLVELSLIIYRPTEPRCTAGETVDLYSGSMSPSGGRRQFLPLQCTNVTQNLVSCCCFLGKDKNVAPSYKSCVEVSSALAKIA